MTATRCPVCDTVGGHGIVHVRHPAGGGGSNVACPVGLSDPADRRVVIDVRRNHSTGAMYLGVSLEGEEGVVEGWRLAGFPGREYESVMRHELDSASAATIRLYLDLAFDRVERNWIVRTSKELDELVNHLPCVIREWRPEADINDDHLWFPQMWQSAMQSGWIRVGAMFNPDDCTPALPVQVLVVSDTWSANPARHLAATESETPDA